MLVERNGVSSMVMVVCHETSSQRYDRPVISASSYPNR